MKRLVFATVLLTFVLVGARTASAGPIMPSFSGAPTGWVTDRYQPNVFADIGLFAGRNNVLEIGIDRAQGSTARPSGYSAPFYNTQGMQYVMTGVVGDSLVADLFVEQSWADAGNGNVRTDLWNGMTDGLFVTEYAIIGFTNYGGAPRFRVWDDDTAGQWVDLADPVNYGAWNSFEIRLNANSIEYYVNGVLAYTDFTLSGTTNFGSTIMQAYNFFDPTIAGANAANYSVHWSNTPTAVPEPATLSLLGLGLVGLVVRLRRRRKD